LLLLLQLLSLNTPTTRHPERSAAQSKDPEGINTTETVQTFQPRISNTLYSTKPTKKEAKKMPSYTYIMGSHTGTLYIGVTSDIYLRAQQHKNGTPSKASRKNTAAPASSTTKPTKASSNP
jgi:GIY-YIG catalytic domain